MTGNREGINGHAQRPVWRTPTLSDDGIADVTLATVQKGGDDGLDASPGYLTTGLS
jgi:hypothetical protein